jgi:hypothetical protein
MAMDIGISRRRFLIGGAMLPAAALAACAGSLRYQLTDVIRRLLQASSQRAFTALLAPDGFLHDEMARVNLPRALGGDAGGNVLRALVLTEPVRRRLLRQLNQVAARAADRAAPVIADAILDMPVIDAQAIIRGGPTAASLVLEQHVGDSLFRALVPGVDEALRLFDDKALNDALRVATGIDVSALRDDVAHQTAKGIFRAMGREEAAIRADPRNTKDPVLIAVFGGRR